MGWCSKFPSSPYLPSPILGHIVGMHRAHHHSMLHLLRNSWYQPADRHEMGGYKWGHPNGWMVYFIENPKRTWVVEGTPPFRKPPNHAKCIEVWWNMMNSDSSRKLMFYLCAGDFFSYWVSIRFTIGIISTRKSEVGCHCQQRPFCGDGAKITFYFHLWQFIGDGLPAFLVFFG